ncbi:MAG TPA: RNA methyltransferase [Oceanospirillales bacterium]|nr:RNA methyltransferase [Oceanospirillales bacterium]
MLNNIRFVLLGTTHSGNIGAAARAMKTMGLNDLALVNPEDFPSAQATSRASGADDLLSQADVCDDIVQALKDSKLVIGTTARKRHCDIPVIDARVAAEILYKESQINKVSLVFGKERYGMTNSEVERCHYLVRLPTVESFSSLNLASAVQVLAYECRMAELAYNPTQNDKTIDSDYVTAEVLDSFYQHYFKVMEDALYLRKEGHDSLKSKIRLMYNRMRPKKYEIDILRGFLSKLEKKLK